MSNNVKAPTCARVERVRIISSVSERARLNRAILENDYWTLPVDDKGHENFMPVDRGARTSNLCGKWLSFQVCDHKELHEGVMVDGIDCTGKIVVSHSHLWCHKSSCPVCFIRGWSVREARNIEGRLKVASERGFGDVEHLTVSVPVEDYGLSEEVLRRKSRMALLVRGVLGGAMIFHGYRKDRSRGVLSWSPHYHVLGFVRGGFDVCRDCVHDRGDCASCSFFKGREVREYAKDKYLVKVLEKRKTVIGTAFYQLNQATIRVGIKRFHVATWFGVCGYSKLKGKKLKAVATCPACHSEMVKKVHWGKRVIAKDIGDPEYLEWFVDDEFDSSGLPNYVDAGGGRVE
jgi:predicted Zn-ribbon and HTH transcriptional regulator